MEFLTVDLFKAQEITVENKKKAPSRLSRGDYTTALLFLVEHRDKLTGQSESAIRLRLVELTGHPWTRSQVNEVCEAAGVEPKRSKPSSRRDPAKVRSTQVIAKAIERLYHIVGASEQVPLSLKKLITQSYSAAELDALVRQDYERVFASSENENGGDL